MNSLLLRSRMLIRAKGVIRVSKDDKGIFSSNFYSLQLQLKTLMEDAGGDHAVQLLDTLSTLNGYEQKVALNIFSRVVNQIAEGDKRIVSEDDRERKEFEETLYQDIMNSMGEAARAPNLRLEVVNGSKADKRPLDLNLARKKRGATSKNTSRNNRFLN